MNDNEYLELETNITVYLSNLIEQLEHNLEGFYDHLSRLACGTDLLMDIDYEIQEGEGDQLKLKVTGNAAEALPFMDFSKVIECWPDQSRDLLLQAVREEQPHLERWLKEADDGWLQETLAQQSDEILMALLTHPRQTIRKLTVRELKNRGRDVSTDTQRSR